MERLKDTRRTANLELERALASAIDWWEENGRDFPWRDTKDPFRILVAELLLQRSRSGSVREVYSDLFESWPTPQDLKDADIGSIIAMIEPLGLQHRAGRIKDLASAWIELDQAPEDIAGLQELPGIGPYSAKATAVAMSWASQPPIDSVSSRVMKRLLGDRFRGNDDDDVAMAVYFYAPEALWRDLNWAILDIAAAFCMPKIPRCEECPLATACGWANSQRKG